MTQTHLPPTWETRLLAVLGAPATPANIRFLDAWGQAEGGTARWNPLNTTLPLPGATDYNSAGVKNYPRPTWGVCATALTLTNGFYGLIVGRLQAGTYPARQIVADCEAQIEKWGTDPRAIIRALDA